MLNWLSLLVLRFRFEVDPPQPMTGERRRHAVMFTAKMTERDLSRARRMGRAALRQWAEDLNSGPVPETAVA